MESIKIQVEEQQENSLAVYFEEIALHANGLNFFDHQEVFIADGETRVALNVLPEVMQLIEQLSFEIAKSTVSSSEFDLGESMFTHDALNEHDMMHVAQIYKGNVAQLYYGLRHYLACNDVEECQRQGQIHFLTNTVARVSGMEILGDNNYVESLIKKGTFKHVSVATLQDLNAELIKQLGDFIIEHVVKTDREFYLDLIKNRFLLD